MVCCSQRPYPWSLRPKCANIYHPRRPAASGKRIPVEYLHIHPPMTTCTLAAAASLYVHSQARADRRTEAQRLPAATTHPQRASSSGRKIQRYLGLREKPILSDHEGNKFFVGSHADAACRGIGDRGKPSFSLGTLRHQDIDLELVQRAQKQVDKYRGGYQAHGLRHAFMPAIVSTSGRIHGELLRLLYILADSRLPVEVFWRTRASLGLVCASRYPVHSGRRPNPLWVASGAPPCLSTIFRV